MTTLAAVAILDTARKLRPKLAAASGHIERERRLPEALVEEFIAGGLFRMLGPRRLGGAELDPLQCARIVAELAHGDASAAWCAMIASQSAWLVEFLTAEGAEEVLGDRRAVVGGQTREQGRATAVDGGYLVNGRWGFLSGIDHCTWVFAVCRVDGSSNMMVWMPVRDLRVIDTWWTAGLCGTGSHDIEVVDLFVPTRRVTHFPPLAEPRHRAPLFKDAVFNLVFVPQAAQALGVAEAMLEHFADMARATSRRGAGMSLREQTHIQIQVAEAKALIDSSWAYLEKTTTEVWHPLTQHQSPSRHARADLRLAITYAINSAVKAGSVLHAAAGAAAVYTEHRLNRPFRDLHAGGAHLQAAPRGYEVTGRIVLGLEPTPGPLLP